MEMEPAEQMRIEPKEMEMDRKKLERKKRLSAFTGYR
jgi:hypothetical protein